MISPAQIEAERSEILKRFRAILRACRKDTSPKEKKIIRQAFEMALDAHKNMRRRTGEPYIYHPMEVAHICLTEIGLGYTSVVCALLHDVVEDTDYTLEDVRGRFGDKIARIIDGLTKISGIFKKENSSEIVQAENMKKMILTLADDVRVILIKLADRLHNMRTLQSMPPEKQVRIANENIFLYIPLAHRLGLYAIKTELEDLSLKYTEPLIHQAISDKLKESATEREKFIKQFIAPIRKQLKDQGIQAEIIGRAKSIFSIWEKMKKKSIPFEEVFDLLAIRVIHECPPEKEKSNCWNIYSIVTDIYRPNPDRLRDWISIPKANGYEALHTTVMSSTGKWVEVQIRSRRMDEIAEKGYAAHWQYKGAMSYETQLDRWLSKIRELLVNSDANALDFLDDFKMNLFSDEIFVFTPKGELRTLPTTSTVLDFAYAIHTQLGQKCIGAKVNHNLVTREYVLKSGDQIEVLTSAIQKPNRTWLGQVATLRAKNEIEKFLKQDKRNTSEQGQTMLKDLFTQLELEFTSQQIAELRNFFKMEDNSELYFDVATGDIGLKEIKEFKRVRERSKLFKKIRKEISKTEGEHTKETTDSVIHSLNNLLILSDKQSELYHYISDCCKPIPGDEIIGYVKDEDMIVVHKAGCIEAIKLMARFSHRIVKSKWNLDNNDVEFLTGIEFAGIDKPGILNTITNILSLEMKLNIHSVNINTSDGLFQGSIRFYVKDVQHLNEIISKVSKVEGIKKTTRISHN